MNLLIWHHLSTWVILFILFSCGGLILFKKILKRHHEKHNSNELVLMIFGMSGTMFSLLIAFVVVSVWEDWQLMSGNVNNEASTLGNMYSFTHHLPDSLRTPLRKSIRKYTETLVEDEWPAMSEEKSSEKSLAAFMDLRKNIHALYKLEGNERDIFNNEFQLYLALSDIRRTRLHSGKSHLPEMVWYILFAGSVLTVVLSFFYKSDNHAMHFILNGFMAIMFSFGMFLCYDLDHPFKGQSRLSPEPFKILLENQFKVSDTVVK